MTGIKVTHSTKEKREKRNKEARFMNINSISSFNYNMYNRNNVSFGKYKNEKTRQAMEEAIVKTPSPRRYDSNDYEEIYVKLMDTNLASLYQVEEGENKGKVKVEYNWELLNKMYRTDMEDFTPDFDDLREHEQAMLLARYMGFFTSALLGTFDEDYLPQEGNYNSAEDEQRWLDDVRSSLAQ